MPAYHSSLEVTDSKGGLPQLDDEQQMAAVKECIKYFRPNVLFRTFELQGPGDRLLIVMTLIITEILKEIKKNQGKKFKNKKDAKKGIRTMIKTQLVW